MADVTGTFGNEHVELNNAATEATLKLILTGLAASNKAFADAVNKVAVKANIDPNTVAAANVAIKDSTVYWGLHKQALTSLISTTSKFTSGTAEASDALGIMAQMKGPLGLVATGLAALASFQESTMKAYQGMTNAGVNFGGSLTDLRMAAANSYLSLDQFANLIKNNSEAFGKMGGNANDGAVAFAKLSNELISSPVGTNLMGLGYTAEQLNGSMAQYISMTGGRTAQEMKDTKALAASATEYLTQLDALAEISGKSREQQEQALKEQSANQAYQSYLLTLDEEGKKKANAAMAEAMAKGGKGAADALQSTMLGLPPMTKAAQQFTALAPDAAKANKAMANAVTDSSKSVTDIRKQGANMGVAVANDVKRMGETTKNALIMQGGELAGTVGQMAGTANQLKRQGIENEADAQKQLDEITEKQKKREESQAQAAAETNKAMKEIGQTILRILGPAIDFGLKVLNSLFGAVSTGLKYFEKLPGVIQGIVLAGLAYLAYRKTVQAAQATAGIVGKVLPGGGGGGGARGGGGGGPLSALTGGGGKETGLILEGLAIGLRAFGVAAPQILIGAAALGTAITLIGAGIAGASWILGKALPSLAEGFKSFSDINGENLISVGKGVGALGLGLAAFGAGGAMASVGGAISGIVDGLSGLFGGKTPIEKIKEYAALGPSLEKAGMGIMNFNKGLASLLTVDLDKVDKISQSMAKLKNAAPERSILSKAGDLLGAAAAAITPATATPEQAPGAGKATSTDALAAQMQTLNKNIAEMLKYAKETADHTKRNVDATKGLNGNLFPTV